MESLQRFLICATRVQAGIRPADWTACTMERCLLAIAGQWFQKPAHEEPEAQQPWTWTRRRSTILGQGVWQGPQSGANASHDAYDVAIPTADDASAFAAPGPSEPGATAHDGQGNRKGDASSCSDGSTTTTFASHGADDSDCRRPSILAFAYAHDALPHCTHSPSSAGAPREPGQRRESPKAIESPAEGDEERGGHFVSQPSVYGARNEETGRKEQNARTPFSSSCLGRRQRRSTGSRKCKGPVAVTVEALLTPICCQMEGVHHELPSFRFSPSSQCTGSPIGSAQSPTDFRHSLKEGAHWQERAMADLRRGGRTHGGHDGGLEGRKCTKDSRWHELHCDEPGGAVIIGRSPRAEGETAKDGRHQRRARGAVFWQGRRYVTSEYNRQGPQLLPVMDAHAVRLHWNHSILQERDFLPEWQAQVHASTLAAELGHHDQLVVDVFALPLRRKMISAKVTFDENIDVYMGLYDEVVYHKVTMQHSTLSSWQGKPWTVRASKNIDREGMFEDGDHTCFMARRPLRHVPSDGGRTSDAATSSSTSSSSIMHASRRQTVLILLNGQMLPARLSWNDGDALAAQISQIVDIDISELIGVHHVPIRPVDLVQQELQCLLLQVRGETRPSMFMKLILIDLEIYEDNEVLPGAFRRFSKWLPLTLNRISAFRLLDLEPLLNEHSDTSRLWHNNVLIPAGQVSPMHLEDGDFLNIRIGSPEGGFACSESEGSSFSVESDDRDFDQVSVFQMFHQPKAPQHSLADADPLSLKAVCISGSCEHPAGHPRVHSTNEPFSFFAGPADSPHHKDNNQADHHGSKAPTGNRKFGTCFAKKEPQRWKKKDQLSM